MTYLAILCAMLFSFPSTFGGKGIYRVKCADIEWLLGERAILLLNADAEGFRYDYGDTIKDYGSGRIGISYVPTNWVETYLLWRVHGVGEAKLPLTETEGEGDLGDVGLGGKLVLKKIKNSYLGGDLSIDLPVGREGYSNNSFIIYPKILTTIDFGDWWRLFPIRGHLNLGIPLGRQGLSENFPITFGMAGELSSRFFSYFMELDRNHERDWNWRFSPGIRVHPFYRISLIAAIDFGLTSKYRLLGANLGLSFNSSLTKEREVMPTGNIAGEIRDKNTVLPIEARIKILELDETVSSHKEYGVYKIIGLPSGIYTLLVEAPNYKPETRMVVVQSNQTNLLNFTLLRSRVDYTGVVMDIQTARPIENASLNIEGKTQVSLLTKSDGTFGIGLIPGEYEIKVNKQNYTQAIRKIAIMEDQCDTIGLKPIEIIAEVPEGIVYFDLNDAYIRNDQRPVLDRIAEFLKGQPKVRCEIRGHTDPSGDIEYNQILSLARANSVMDYFVKVHGIEKERISTLAFSKTKLVREESGKSRRVEIFLIR